jgi:ABC-type transport system involved in multi-copper enzyme maturation permease subunit
MSVLALTVVAIVGLGILGSYLASSRWGQLAPGDQTPFQLINRSLLGVDLAQLTIAVLGVVVITGEYTTGMIRATLGAVPRRLPVLWGKAIVFATVAFAVTLVSSFVAFFAGQSILGAHGVSLSYPGALRMVVGVALYLTVVGLLGLALGFLIRSTAGGITAVVGLLLVLPQIVKVFPTSWQNDISPYLPSNAGQAVYGSPGGGVTMGPWTGFALFCGYAAIAIAGAAWALRHRDG